MSNTKSATFIKDQELSLIIYYINQQRINAMNSELRIINKDYINSQKELELCKQSIKEVIDSNRGAKTGMHGFIGERVQVHFSNSRALLNGESPLYRLLDDGSAVDYIRGTTPIQQKACLSDKTLGLTHIANHAKVYPDFVESGGIYQIPKDLYERYIALLNTPKNIALKMQKSDLRLWRKIQDFTQDNPKITIEPMVCNYHDIQVDTVEKTIKTFSEENKEIYKNDQATVVQHHAPNLKEGALASIKSGCLEGCFEGIECFSDKLINDKPFSDFTSEDYIDIGLSTGKGVIVGTIRNASTYYLTNYLNISFPIASASVSSTINIANEVEHLAKGEITPNECLNNSIEIGTKAILSTTYTVLTTKCLEKVLPSKIKWTAPIIGSIAGGFVGSKLYDSIKELLTSTDNENEVINNG